MKYKIARLWILSAVFGIFSQVSLAAPGDLDAGFGANGKVSTVFPAQTTTFRPRSGISAIVIQPDGKIVAGGYAFISPNGVAAGPAFALTRYNPDGSLDTGFGSGGKLTTYINGYEEIQALALQADGKIVAAGFTDLGGNNFAFAIARYNANGSLDTGFDGDGKLVRDITPMYDLINGLAIQPDGKIIASGYANAGVATDFATIRYNSNGTADNGFGTGGLVRTDLGGVEGGSEVVLLPGGRIVVAGTLFGSDGIGYFALVGYDPTGNLDTGFGTGGIVHTDLFGNSNDNASDMALAPDGKIVVCGYSGPAGAYDFAVARYNQNGSLDTTFDNDGKFAVDMTGNGRIDGANGVAVQQNGKIILIGRAQLANDTPFDLAIARVNAGGGLDGGFGSGGKVFTDFNDRLPNSFNATNDEFRDVLIQADGKIVVAGDIEDQTHIEYDMALARYIGDPVNRARTAVSDFNGDGRSDISVYRPADGSWHISDSAGSYSAAKFGIETDKIAAADYDGDGKTDIAVFRDGAWYWVKSSNGGIGIAQFGAVGDIPLPLDYDGDGRAELAVYRAGTWYLMNTSNNRVTIHNFGMAGDRPAPADFDGDGKSDPAVYRDGVWYWMRSVDGGFGIVQFGLAADKPVIGDYDGDGKADPAVYRSGTWYILGTASRFFTMQFGIASDVPAPADYDGDGKTDAAVYRNGAWYLQQSQRGIGMAQFGLAADKPVPAAFLP